MFLQFLLKLDCYNLLPLMDRRVSPNTLIWIRLYPRFWNKHSVKCMNVYDDLNFQFYFFSDSSSFVNEAKFCINGLNQKINSMEDTVGLYKKELEQVKSELNEHLILCRF